MCTRSELAHLHSGDQPCMNTSRRLRALARMAGLWAGAWTAVSVAVLLITAFHSRQYPPAEVASSVLETGVVAGAISGLIFGGLLGVAERNRTLSSLSRVRVTLWGMVAAIVPPAVQIAGLFSGPATSLDLAPVLARIFGLMGLLGAGWAGLMISLAQGVGSSAPRPDGSR